MSIRKDAAVIPALDRLLSAGLSKDGCPDELLWDEVMKARADMKVRENLLRGNSGRPGWDTTWMSVALVIAERSICDRAKVGAVIVSPKNRLLATGYNGPPSGQKSTIEIAGVRKKASCLYDCPRAQKKPEDLDPGYTDCITIHAEMNAIAFCDRTAMDKSTLYCTGSICHGCAKVIANTGIKRVVCRVDREREFHRKPDFIVKLLEECGLTVVVREVNVGEIY